MAVVLLGSPASAGLSPGIEAGWSLTSVTFKEPSGEWQNPQAQNSFTGGVTVRAFPWKRYGFRTGFRYTERSVRVSYARYPGYWDTYAGEFHIEEHYIGLPLWLEARPPGSGPFFLTFGPELSFLREGHFQQEQTWIYGSGGTNTQTWDEDRRADMKSTEWSLRLGGGVEFPAAGHWASLELGYSIGLTGVGDMHLYSPWESDWRNQALELLMGARW